MPRFRRPARSTSVDTLTTAVPLRTTAAAVSVPFERFVADEQRGLQDFAYLVIGNREDARDAVQEALVGAYRHWNRIMLDPGPYVRRSIVNTHISAWRKRKRETLTDDFTQVSVGPPGVDELWLRRMCAVLPKKQRAAVVLRFFEDQSFEDIARTLECSPATARSLVSRAIATLRRNESEEQS